MLLLLMVAPLSLTSVQNSLQQSSDRTYQKALIIDPEYVLGEINGTIPFSILRSGGFTIVGTVARGSWSPAQEWARTQTWIKSVKAAGFKAAIDLEPRNGNQILGMTEEAATIGADVVFLDEILSQYPNYVTESVLQSIILAGRSINPNLQYYINEWSSTYIVEAYRWTAGYSYVQVAEDDYDNLPTIDYNINLASQYGKTPGAWLIFAQGSREYSCYDHFSSWVAYAEPMPEDTLFWYVDASKTYLTDWPEVQAFSYQPTGYSTLTIGLPAISIAGDNTGNLIVQAFTPSINVTVTKVGVDAPPGVTGNLTTVLYADPSGIPTTLLGHSANSVAHQGWNDLSLGTPVQLVAGTQYAMGFEETDSNYPTYYYNANNKTGIYRTVAYGTFPNPFGTPHSGNNFSFLLRATYATNVTASTSQASKSIENTQSSVSETINQRTPINGTELAIAILAVSVVIVIAYRQRFHRRDVNSG